MGIFKRFAVLFAQGKAKIPIESQAVGFQCYRPHMIKKIKSKYVVLSESSGRSFGSYKTKKEAVTRLQQVEFFKHLESSPALKRKLKNKSLIK